MPQNAIGRQQSRNGGPRMSHLLKREKTFDGTPEENEAPVEYKEDPVEILVRSTKKLLLGQFHNPNYERARDLLYSVHEIVRLAQRDAYKKLAAKQRNVDIEFSFNQMQERDVKRVREQLKKKTELIEKKVKQLKKKEKYLKIKDRQLKKKETLLSDRMSFVDEFIIEYLDKLTTTNNVGNNENKAENMEQDTNEEGDDCKD